MNTDSLMNCFRVFTTMVSTRLNAKISAFRSRSSTKIIELAPLAIYHPEMPLPSCVLSSLPPSAPLYPVASRITRQILISSSSAASSSSSSSSSTSHSNHAIDSQRYKGNEYQLDENLATLSSIKVASSGPFNDLITFPYRGIPGFPALCGSTLTNTDQPPIYVFQYPGGKSLWRVETENDGYITTELYSDRLTEWWQFLSSLSSIDKPSIILDLTAQKELDLLTSFCYYPPTRDEQLIFHPIHSIDQSDFNLNIQLNDVLKQTPWGNAIKYLIQVAGDDQFVVRKHFWGNDEQLMKPQQLDWFVSKMEPNMVVHCKDGVGRTGVVVTAYFLKQMVKQGRVKQNNLRKQLDALLKQLRLERGSNEWVQTIEQAQAVYDYGVYLLQQKTWSKKDSSVVMMTHDFTSSSGPYAMLKSASMTVTLAPFTSTELGEGFRN